MPVSAPCWFRAVRSQSVTADTSSRPCRSAGRGSNATVLEQANFTLVLGSISAVANLAKFDLRSLRMNNSSSVLRARSPVSSLLLCRIGGSTVRC